MGTPLEREAAEPDAPEKVRRAEDLSSSNAFLRALAREASRSERAGDPFSVIRLTGRKAKKEDFEAIRAFCAQRLPITDEAGWLDEDKAVGILLPGATLFEARTVAKTRSGRSRSNSVSIKNRINPSASSP